MPSVIPTHQIQDLFKPLLGQFAWNVRGGVGSMLTLEFGAPHIIVGEPVVPRAATSERVRRLLRRRNITVVGDWDLFIQYCDWKIWVSAGSSDSESFDWRRPDECLRDLDGQRLVGVGGGSLPNSWKFEFDLGGVFEFWPSNRIQGDQRPVGPLRLENDDTQEMRFIVSVHNDGTLGCDKAVVG
jgi:hypothetical protein